MRWSRDALTADLTINGVAEFGDPGFPLAEWWSYDLQGSLSLDWGGEIVLGAQNLTGRQSENVNFRHHDYGGRTLYMRYRQTF